MFKTQPIDLRASMNRNKPNNGLGTSFRKLSAPLRRYLSPDRIGFANTISMFGKFFITPISPAEKYV
jgi:hypothetical protein